MFEAYHFDALRQVDVSIVGDWQEGLRRDWRGQALASEPVVAISFVVRGTRVSWCKSQRANPLGQPVGISLGHYDSTMRDVQVRLSIGEGQVVSRTVVDSTTYRPNVQGEMNAVTARFIPLAIVEGTHLVELYALFLAGADVKVGRNGLWHLRSELVGSVPANFRKMLSYGRTGEWAAAR